MLNAYGRFASLGVQLTASMCVLGYGGYWLDGKFDTYPWLMIAGLMLGVGFAVMLEMFSRRIHTRDDLLIEVQVPLLGHLTKYN